MKFKGNFDKKLDNIRLFLVKNVVEKENWYVSAFFNQKDICQWNCIEQKKDFRIV